MADVIDLESERAARELGGWRAAPFRCACGREFVSTAPAGAARPACPGCGLPCSRAVDPVALPDGSPDPHLQHRRELVSILEEMLAEAVAGRVDGALLLVHLSPAHPDGAGWQTAFTGNVDFVTRLGGLELMKADMIHRANAGGPK